MCLLFTFSEACAVYVIQAWLHAMIHIYLHVYIPLSKAANAMQGGGREGSNLIADLLRDAYMPL